MTIYEFILSDKRFDRVTRHLLFWLVIGFLYFLQSIVPGRDVIYTALISIISFFPVSVIAAYANLYWGFPTTLQQRKYLLFLTFCLVTAIVSFGLNFLGGLVFVELAKGYVLYHSKSSAANLALVNTSHAMVITGLTLGIKFTKNWYLQRKENVSLAREKIQTELQLEKARLYPRFLFPSLHQVSERIVAASSNAPGLLLQISELLSYILYDSTEKYIPLKKELEMVQTRVELEHSNRRGEVDITLDIKGEVLEKSIPPMAVFAMVEDSIKITEGNVPGKAEIKIGLTVKANCIEAIVHITGIDLKKINQEDSYQLFQKNLIRLELIHSGRVEVNVKRESNALHLFFELPIKSDIQIEALRSKNIVKSELYE